MIKGRPFSLVPEASHNSGTSRPPHLLPAAWALLWATGAGICFPSLVGVALGGGSLAALLVPCSGSRDPCFLRVALSPPRRHTPAGSLFCSRPRDLRLGAVVPAVSLLALAVGVSAWTDAWRASRPVAGALGLSRRCSCCVAHAAHHPGQGSRAPHPHAGQPPLTPTGPVRVRSQGEGAFCPALSGLRWWPRAPRPGPGPMEHTTALLESHGADRRGWGPTTPQGPAPGDRGLFFLSVRHLPITLLQGPGL